MDSRRAGKQTKAFWRAVAKAEAKWEAEPMYPVPIDTPYQISKQRAQGFAAGWIAGVAWAKRNSKR